MEFFKPGKQDLAQIRANGLSLETIHRQLSIITQGAPYMDLVRPCTVGDGIRRLSADEARGALSAYETAAPDKKRIKFVPASGAATRMFKHLTVAYQGLQGGASFSRPEDRPSKPQLFEFMDNCHKFAFYGELKAALSRSGLDVGALLKHHDFLPILAHLIEEKHLNYAALPKGLIKFHAYGPEVRTAFEEHLAEGHGYAGSRDGGCALHFTVTPQHQERISRFLNTVLRTYEKRCNTRFHLSFSTQKNDTNTIAVDLDNQPYRCPDGSLLFRPGGHGALIDNLNALEADVVFIKNIDNVAHERYLSEIVEWKKILGGLLLAAQQQVFHFLEQLHRHPLDPEWMQQAALFLQTTLSRSLPKNFETAPLQSRQEALIHLLDRPLRVCGMVPNAGDPGGGPFWTRDATGDISLQIVETSQIDAENPDQRAIAGSATHFNPVDLVCGIRNWRNEAFDLSRYVDDQAVFIASKTEGGQAIKALELPGLWNGAMAFWNTIFVEVPPVTFNPVKEVTDLLREGHQPADATH